MGRERLGRGGGSDGNVEKTRHDGHEYSHGRDDQEAVSAADVEKSLGMRAGEDDNEKASSKSSRGDIISPVSGKDSRSR